MGSIANSDHREKGEAALDPADGDAPATGWAAWIGIGGRSGLGHKARARGKAVGNLAGSGADWLAAPDSYWRRRFFILAGGLAFLGLITWGVSALLGSAKPIGGTRPARPAASAGKAAPRPAPARSEAARAGPATPTVTPPGAALPAAAYGPPVTPPSASPTLAASPASAPGASAGGAPAGGTAAAGGQCQPSGIVLSLLTSKPAYGPREQPQFTVYVVSTAPSPCQVAYTSPFTHVVVTRSGEVVWDSTACAAAGGPARTAQFTPGVPVVVALSWNRKAASQACAGTIPAGASGPLAAVAMAAGKSSPVHWFSLTG